MTPKALYREIGLIDEDLLVEAESAGKHRTRTMHLRWLPAAACLALVLAVGVWQSKPLVPPMTNPGIIVGDVVVGDEAADKDSDPDSLTLNHADEAVAVSRVINAHFWQELTTPEISAVFPAADHRRDSYAITATANYSKTAEAGIRLVDVVGEFLSKDGVTARVTTSPSEIMKCYLLDGEPVLSEIGGVSIDAGYFDKTNDGSILYYADFKLGDVYYYVELHGGKEEKAALTALLDHLISGGKANFGAITPNPPAVLRSDTLTLQEAREDGAFGAYIPQGFPTGFGLNGACRFVNQQSDFLSVSLSNGMNNLWWRVSRLEDESRSRITSVADTQNYDLARYPIPRADSVPEELRDIVDQPIFKIEELTLPVIKARAYQMHDAGDIGGYCMDFGVLYDNILVEVSTKGVSPEAIFAALTEIPYGFPVKSP